VQTSTEPDYAAEHLKNVRRALFYAVPAALIAAGIAYVMLPMLFGLVKNLWGDYVIWVGLISLMTGVVGHLGLMAPRMYPKGQIALAAFTFGCAVSVSVGLVLHGNGNPGLICLTLVLVVMLVPALFRWCRGV
jgi:hypothetical protein